jgi:hypothetical protein
MKTEQEDIVEQQSVPDNASAITVSAEDHNKIIRDYQREIYSEIIGSIVRETTSNAVDAHDEADTDRNVEVALYGGSDEHLGLPKQAKFVVRDFGIGMSDEFVREGFSLYRNSTKNDSDELIGGYGIGAKCPLGYTDTFLMDCYYDGVHRRYQLQRHQDGDYLTCLLEEETDRTNGVTVIVPIEEADMQDFQEACVEQLAYLSPGIDFLGKAPNFDLPEVKHESESFTLLSDSITHGKYQRYSSTAINGLHVTVGNIPYEINKSKIDDLDYRAANMSRLCLNFEVGELDLNLPREELRYTEKTTDAITERLNDARQTMKEKIMESTKDLQFENRVEKGLTYEAIENGKNDELEELGFDEDAGPAADLYDDFQTLGGSPNSASDDLTNGKLRKVDSTYMHSRSHNTSLVHSNYKRRNVIRQNMTGQQDNIYVATINSDTARNRYLAEQHSTAYVWHLDEDDEMYEDALEEFESYDDMDFDRQEYTTSHDDDEIPCYHLTSASKRGKQCKWARNYEDTDEIRQAVEDGERWVWGLQDDKEALWEVEQLFQVSSSEQRPEDVQRNVVRVSKKNARRYFRGDHVHVSDLSDWVEERKETLVRDYKTYRVASKHDWMTIFEDYPDLQNFSRLHAHVENAVRECHHSSTRSHASNLFNQSDNSDDLDVWSEAKPQVHRLRKYGESIKAIKKAKSWSGFRSGIEQSVLYLLRPIANRMKDVEPIDDSE